MNAIRFDVVYYEAIKTIRNEHFLALGLQTLKLALIITIICLVRKQVPGSDIAYVNTFKVSLLYIVSSLLSIYTAAFLLSFCYKISLHIRIAQFTRHLYTQQLIAGQMPRPYSSISDMTDFGPEGYFDYSQNALNSDILSPDVTDSWKVAAVRTIRRCMKVQQRYLVFLQLISLSTNLSLAFVMLVVVTKESISTCITVLCFVVIAGELLSKWYFCLIITLHCWGGFYPNYAEELEHQWELEGHYNEMEEHYVTFNTRQDTVDLGQFDTLIYSGNSKSDIRSRNGSHRSEDELTCSICLSAMQKGERYYLLKCKHMFHGNCLAEWSRSGSACPVCRSPMQKP